MTNGTLLLTFDCLKNGNSIKNAVSSMNRIAAKAGWGTRAISVMSPDQVNWPGDFTSNWRAEFEKVGRAALTKFLKRNHAGQAPESSILFQPYKSKKGSVQAVLNEVSSSKPSALAVFTHTARTGRGMPAGFVSSLIAKSGVPVFVVSAKAPPLKTLKTIVFATDFSEVDAAAFEQALDFAKTVSAKVVIAHVMLNIVNETMTAYAGITSGWPAYSQYLEVQESDANEQGQKWVAKAKARGVVARYELISNSNTIWTGLLKSAKKEAANLIVMTEKTGPWEAVFLGSVTREILEKATVPVLVMPATEKKASRKA